jgi:2-polyprenyl-3-methyl-5-hydroxy-6-metoxy-1,4-benzoquinol methylase
MIREEIIKKYVEYKNVLDIGSIGQTDSYSLWNLYPQFNVKSITGIDIEEITNENKKLFNIFLPDFSSEIVTGDMETYSFNKEFDVIVAGDVIEHVSNQGLFLNNIKKHLQSNGKLIITTPNAKWPTVFLKPNPTHTLWHDKYTLNRVLELNGFKIEYYKYYFGNKKYYNFLKQVLTIRQSLLVIASKY